MSVRINPIFGEVSSLNPTARRPEGENWNDGFILATYPTLEAAIQADPEHGEEIWLSMLEELGKPENIVQYNLFEDYQLALMYDANQREEIIVAKEEAVFLEKASRKRLFEELSAQAETLKARKQAIQDDRTSPRPSMSSSHSAQSLPSGTNWGASGIGGNGDGGSGSGIGSGGSGMGGGGLGVGGSGIDVSSGIGGIGASGIGGIGASGISGTGAGGIGGSSHGGRLVLLQYADTDGRTIDVPKGTNQCDIDIDLPYRRLLGMVRLKEFAADNKFAFSFPKYVEKLKANVSRWDNDHVGIQQNDLYAGISTYHEYES